MKPRMALNSYLPMMTVLPPAPIGLDILPSIFKIFLRSETYLQVCNFSISWLYIYDKLLGKKNLLFKPFLSASVKLWTCGSLVCVCGVWVCMYQSTLWRSVLLPHGFWDLNSGCQGFRMNTLLPGSSHQPESVFVDLFSQCFEEF